MENLDFSDFFTTKAQASEFTTRIATLSEMTYQTNFNLEQVLMEQFGIEKKDKFMRLLQDANVNTQSATTLKAFFDKMREEVAALPVLPLTIAFEPTDQTLKLLSGWINLNVKKQIIFDISVNRHLVAGAAITFNGKFLDFSFKERFDKIVQSILATPASHVASETARPTAPTHTVDNMHMGR
jgi:hypothetical protein